MKVVLCTHHKGGVGKTELAVHVAGIFRQELSKTLLINCDSQTDVWRFQNLSNPLAVIASLEEKVGIKVITRIVPMGVENARARAIRERFEALRPAVPEKCEVMPRIRPLGNKANLARKRRKYIWEYADCADLEAYYRKLLTLE